MQLQTCPGNRIRESKNTEFLKISKIGNRLAAMACFDSGTTDFLLRYGEGKWACNRLFFLVGLLRESSLDENTSCRHNSNSESDCKHVS